MTVLRTLPYAYPPSTFTSSTSTANLPVLIRRRTTTHMNMGSFSWIHLFIISSLIYFFHLPLSCLAGTQTYEISQICGKGQFPQQNWDIDGAVIVSKNEKNLDCSVTFKAEYVTQKFLIRFEEFQMDCGDHLDIYDSSTASGNARAELNCRYLRPEDIGVIRTRGHSVTIRFVADNWGTSGRHRFTMVITAYKDASQGCRDSFHCSKDNTCISNRLLCDNVYNCMDGADEMRSANCSSNFILDFIASVGAGDSTIGILMISGLVVITTVIVLSCVCFCQKRRAQGSSSSSPHIINNHSKRGNEDGPGTNGAGTTMIALSDKTGLQHCTTTSSLQRHNLQQPQVSTTLDSIYTSKSGNLHLPAESLQQGYSIIIMTLHTVLHLHRLPCYMGN